MEDGSHACAQLVNELRYNFNIWYPPPDSAELNRLHLENSVWAVRVCRRAKVAACAYAFLEDENCHAWLVNALNPNVSAFSSLVKPLAVGRSQPPLLWHAVFRGRETVVGNCIMPKCVDFFETVADLGPWSAAELTNPASISALARLEAGLEREMRFYDLPQTAFHWVPRRFTAEQLRMMPLWLQSLPIPAELVDLLTSRSESVFCSPWTVSAALAHGIARREAVLGPFAWEGESPKMLLVVASGDFIFS
ncbi:unnamed protein product [Polarella glacialis]|uniref:Uncharacterized protein n=1 Tax=Polarella glacialis TaxID=89957 RepID=A0A813JAC7_POLGL|nr:unnamed protein product [Polarella glacialis]